MRLRFRAVNGGTGFRGAVKRSFVLWCAGMAAGGVLLGGGAAVIDEPLADARWYVERVVPASSELGSVVTEANTVQTFVLAALAAPAEQRAALIADAQEHTTRMSESWSAYLLVAIGAPGEEELQATFETLTLTGRERAIALLTATPSTPEYDDLLAGEQAGFSRRLAVLDQLRAEIYQPLVQSRPANLEDDVEGASRMLVVLVAVAVGLFTSVSIVVVLAARRAQNEMVEETARLRAVGEQIDFEAALQRGLDLAPDEARALDVAHRALAAVGGDAQIEVLLAAPAGTQTQLHRAVSADDDLGCEVCDLRDCPVAVTGHAAATDSSEALDACPRLRDDDQVRWASCVPVNLAGQPAGVIHAQDEVARPRPAHLDRHLQVIAHRLGERLTAIRLMDRTSAHARTDPLTGLVNRRELGDALARLDGSMDAAYTLAYADIDHFKVLNDTYGHDTGDRALRLLARVLRGAVRPNDLVARQGGEEFVIVLPDCGPGDAVVVAERIRADLASATASGPLPTFTVTIGLASSRPGELAAAVLDRADGALLLGKTAGRDRVVVDDSEAAIGIGT